MSNILKLAISELGTTEIKGDQHNSRIIEYAHQAGFNFINDDETPWCSIFINWLASKLNIEKSNKLDARSWLNIGQEISDPKPGDIVIFWRGERDGWKGHVAVFLGYDSKNNIFCIGGNQSNSVSIATYDSNKVLGFRRLQEIETIEIPKATLRIGSHGDEVIKLQLMLNSLDFNCGDPDGDFGYKTEKALKELQVKLNLYPDGIYSKNLENHIISLNQQ